jgi:membrane protease YdiL (CAAX protease family)
LVALVILYAVVDTALVLSPVFIHFLRFHGAHYNWGGMVAGFTFACMLLAWSPWLRQNVGLYWRQSSGSFRLSVICFLTCIAAGIVSELPMRPETFSLETLLFQAFVPSITEELSYRGIMMSLLERAFGHSPMSCRMHYGWAAVITSLMFGLLHWPDPTTMIFAAAAGSMLALVRTRSGSLLWPILCHTALNLPHHAVSMVL